MSKFESLFQAISDGTIDDVKYLVEKKGEKVSENDLHYYADKASVEVLEYLISKGANVNYKDSYGQTPLHNAASSNSVEVLECLISKGANINAKDKIGETPLFRAVRDNPHVEVLKYLVSKGAKTNVRNNFNLTPMDFARKNGKENLLPSSGGGCYIATYVYGSYNCPEVWTLRRYRDGKLTASWLGRWFIRIYYAMSPRIVDLFGKKKWFNRLCKPILNKFIRKLHQCGIDSSPYFDLLF